MSNAYLENQLTVIESGLKPMVPVIKALLPPDIRAEKLVQTALVSCRLQPSVANCSLTSIVNAAITSANLGLLLDGVSGQGYIIPYRGQAQMIPGFKGYITMADRGRWTMDGFVVREGDAFEFDLGRQEYRLRPQLGDEANRQLVAVVGVARHPDLPQKLRVLSLDQVIERRDGSKGYQSSIKQGKAHPWETHFAPMARKTALRELAKDMPLYQMNLGAALETQHDLGHHMSLDMEGRPIIDGEIIPDTPKPPRDDLTERQEFSIEWIDNRVRKFPSIELWVASMEAGIGKLADKEGKLETFLRLNQARIDQLDRRYPDEVGRVLGRFAKHGVKPDPVVI